MRVLLLTYRFPYPPDRGDKVRPWHFARVLAQEHEVHLVSFAPRAGEPDGSQAEPVRSVFRTVTMVPLASLQANIRMAGALLGQEALQMALFRSRAMQGAVRDAMRAIAPDVVYAYHVRMGQYLPLCADAYRILDLADAVSLFMERMIPHRPPWLRPLLRREVRLVRDLEASWPDWAEEAWITSAADRTALPPARGGAQPLVMPNGVDAERFGPLVPAEERDGLLFVGYMGIESQDAVCWLCHEILPQVRRLVGREVGCRIIGGDAPKQVERLAAIPGVTVEGYEPELRDAYARAAVVVAPMRFVAGMQNKVLEAMACEAPVVATPYANEGIGAAPGREIEVAATAEEFAQKTAALLLDAERRRRLGEVARAFVVARFAWEAAAERVSAIERGRAGHRQVPVPVGTAAGAL